MSTLHIWALKIVTHACIPREKETSISTSVFSYLRSFLSSISFTAHHRINKSHTRKSPRRSMISGKYPRRKYGRSISRSSRHAMRDRLESEHVFFPDQLRFFNLVYLPFLILFSFSFSPVRTNVYQCFYPISPLDIRTTAYYSVSISDRGGSENFLAGKKSSHSNARWKFGSEFFAPSCGITNSAVHTVDVNGLLLPFPSFFLGGEFIELRWPPFHYDTSLLSSIFSVFRFRFARVFKFIRINILLRK